MKNNFSNWMYLYNRASRLVKEIQDLFPSCTVCLSGSLVLKYWIPEFDRGIHDVDIVIEVPQKEYELISKHIRNYVWADRYSENAPRDVKQEYPTDLVYTLGIKILGEFPVNLIVDVVPDGINRGHSFFNPPVGKTLMSGIKDILLAKQRYNCENIRRGKAPRQKDIEDCRIIFDYLNSSRKRMFRTPKNK